MEENEMVPSVEPVEQEPTTEVIESPEEKQEAQKLIKKLKLKVDGEEFEEEIDLNDEATLIKELQLAKAAKKRMFEAQEAKKKAFELVSQFDKDPATLLKRLGPKGYELAEQLLLEKIQQEQMSPEQREFLEMKAKLEAYENQEKERTAQEQQQKQQAMEMKQAEKMQGEIITALQKAGAPSTPEAVKRMAGIYLKNLELGLELDVFDLADEYKKEVSGYLATTFKDASPEQIISMFGKDVIKKIRDFDVKQLKEKQKINKPSHSMRAPPPPGKSEYMTPDEWLEKTRRSVKE